MTRQVSLSERAYKALRQERQDQESFSQTILRLLDTIRRTRKDPLAFVARPRRRAIPADEHLALVEKWRDEDPAE